ncbi:MAG: riboflavin biosynthesis protein RibF [bacterium]
MSETGAIIAVGGFDGVHLGHQAILDTARRLARELNTIPGVLTLDPLPAQLLNPDFTFVLTPLEEKIQLLKELGAAFVRVIRFDEPVSRLEPAEFVEREVLALEPRAVVVGHDHRFGHRGRGDVDFLRRQLEPRGVRVEVVPEFVLRDAPVRSTRIRERLLLGDVGRAAELLGRHYRVAGPVVTGTGTGRRLGFPTLNIAVREKEKLVPADGVYAAWAVLNGRRRPAALNIGHRPTFGGETRTVEAHLLDGKVTATPAHLAVLFVARLRPERRFPDQEALARRIAEDAAAARRILGDAGRDA